MDTAGLRESGEAIEREGVARARRQVAGAAVVVYLLDAAEGTRPEDAAALGSLGDRAVAVWNKADLAPGPLGPPAALAVSALHGDGMEALGETILARLGYRPTAYGDAVPFTAAQAGALERARDALARGDAAVAKERLESLAGGATSAG